ncbi:MAG: cysteine desulfurase NifS [Bacillota bacterium]|jgi:cysteine desulfurase
MVRSVYLDHSATTPVRLEVSELMQQYLRNKFGNPSSLHSYGRQARQGLNWAREQAAEAIGANPTEILFTSGGTEADNLAILGTAYAYQDRGRHIITSCIEHHAVLDSCKYLEKRGFRVTYLPVNEYGEVDLTELDRVLDDDTILISIMHANNEIGTIQPIAEIGRRAQERSIPFHTDAVQSLGKVPIDVKQLGVSLLSASAHKIYGPKGAGMLYIREGSRLDPLWHGGSQEQKIRPGTENVAGIVGFGRAVELAIAEMESVAGRINRLRDRLWEEIQTRISAVKLNGHPSQRIPGHLNISFVGLEGQSLLTALDEKGIAASSGSACMAGAIEPSHVLQAIGLSADQVQGSIRLTLGRDNTHQELDYVLEELPRLVEQLRGPSWNGPTCPCER